MTDFRHPHPSAPIGIGIVGCGQISQIMHLPYLAASPDFRLVAISDASERLLTAVSARFHPEKSYADYRELLADPAVDAVGIFSHDHTAVARTALERGKHVLIEKPLCFTSDDAKSLLELERHSGCVAMVGYMKRFDPTVEEAIQRVSAMDHIHSVHVHNYAGSFSWHESLYDLVPRPHGQGATPGESQAHTISGLGAALPSADPRAVNVYLTVLMLGSHDLALLDGFCGLDDVTVDYARVLAEDGITAYLTLNRETPCILEIDPNTTYSWWDERLTFCSRDEELTLTFRNPYLHNAPTKLLHRRTKMGSAILELGPEHHEEAFRREWQHFAWCIRNGSRPATSLSAAARHIQIAEELIGALG
jgi:predicted dehydrogenase